MKQSVFGVFEGEGRVYTEIVPDCKRLTLQAIMLGKVSIESVIYSDGWRGYSGLVDAGYSRHFRVNHGDGKFARDGHCHSNRIESFWSFIKRRIAKFNRVSVNFEFHLKESEWRWKNNLTKWLLNYSNSSDILISPDSLESCILSQQHINYINLQDWELV